MAKVGKRSERVSIFKRSDGSKGVKVGGKIVTNLPSDHDRNGPTISHIPDSKATVTLILPKNQESYKEQFAIYHEVTAYSEEKMKEREEAGKILENKIKDSLSDENIPIETYINLAGNIHFNEDTLNLLIDESINKKEPALGLAVLKNPNVTEKVLRHILKAEEVPSLDTTLKIYEGIVSHPLATPGIMSTVISKVNEASIAYKVLPNVVLDILEGNKTAEIDYETLAWVSLRVDYAKTLKSLENGLYNLDKPFYLSKEYIKVLKKNFKKNPTFERKFNASGFEVSK